MLSGWFCGTEWTRAPIDYSILKYHRVGGNRISRFFASGAWGRNDGLKAMARSALHDPETQQETTENMVAEDLTLCRKDFCTVPDFCEFHFCKLHCYSPWVHWLGWALALCKDFWAEERVLQQVIEEESNQTNECPKVTQLLSCWFLQVSNKRNERRCRMIPVKDDLHFLYYHCYFCLHWASVFPATVPALALGYFLPVR